MRIKILKENFYHNKLLSILIILCATFISILTLLSLELNNYLVFANIENAKYQYNDYDIVISANIPLSLSSVEKYQDEDINLNQYYKNVSSYYSTTLMVSYNQKEEISNIIEADSGDYQNLFKLDNIPSRNEAVITTLLANKLGLQINEEIIVYLRNQSFTYKIIDIIEPDLIYNGNFILLGGRNITYSYGINNVKMPNNIVIDLINEEDVEEVTNYLTKEFNFCQVNNLMDKEVASRQVINTIPTICMITSFVFLVLLLILCNIYSYKMKKQREVFISFKKKNYYLQINLIAWILIFTISLILSFISTKLLLSLFNPIFNVSKNFNISLINIFVGNLLFLLVPIILLFKNIKFTINHKVKLFITLVLLIISFIMAIFIKNSSLKDVFTIITLIIAISIVVNIIIEFTQFIKPLLTRVYLYNLNKNNSFIKLLLLVQISTMICLCLIISCVSLYQESIASVENFIKINTVIATTSKANISTKYEHIKVANNVLINDNETDYLINLNSKQIELYTNIELTEEEALLFEKHKGIILPVYYSNKYHYNIDDTIVITINGKEEEFIIIKFLEGLTTGLTIVSNSETMYDAYIIDSEIPVKEVISDFSKTTYYIIDIDSSIQSLKVLHHKLVNVINSILVFIIVVLCIFSLYIFNLNFLYKKETFIKLKKLGLNNTMWNKMSIIRSIGIILICIIFGFVLEIVIMNKFNNMLKLFNTILQMNYTIFNSFLSVIIIFVNAVIGNILNSVEYKKI